MKEMQEIVQLEIDKLHKAKAVLLYSFQKCTLLNNPSNFTDEEAEHIEAYTARFCRLADIFLHSTLKLIDIVDLENEGTVRDRLNRAEKKLIVQSLEKQIEIRKLRNKMAHEYLSLSLPAFLESAFELTPILIEDIDKAIKYLQNNL